MILERVKYLFKVGKPELTAAKQRTFGLLFEQIEDTVDLPVYIMTSEKNNEMIFAALEQLNFLGFTHLFVFPQVAALYPERRACIH